MVYIGQTTQKPETRWGKDGINYCNNRAFYRDIKKYGWDNFSHEILEIVEAKSYDELKQKLNNVEGHYIIKFESMLLGKGYNVMINSDKLSTKFSLGKSRAVSRLVKNGIQFTDAHNKYKEYKLRKRK